MTGTRLALAMVEGNAADMSLRGDLQRVAGQRIYFAHQSVGSNLIDGLMALAAKEGVRVRVSSLRVGRNGDPAGKLRSFERAMAGQGRGSDVAIFKFCYADVRADTDARALFDAYRTALDRLRNEHPETTFVHVTLPLTDVQGGLKALAKLALGRHPYGTVENLRREEYNTLMRRHYRGREPLFDLARVESTAPDGAAVRVVWEERLAPALAREYTDDGGHLNVAGRTRAARELVSVLASIDSPLGASCSPSRLSA